MDNNFMNGGADGVQPDMTQPVQPMGMPQPEMTQPVQPMGMPQPDMTQPVQPMGMPQPDMTQPVQPMGMSQSDMTQPVQPMGMPQPNMQQQMPQMDQVQPSMGQPMGMPQPDMQQQMPQMDQMQPSMEQPMGMPQPNMQQMPQMDQMQPSMGQPMGMPQPDMQQQMPQMNQPQPMMGQQMGPVNGGKPPKKQKAPKPPKVKKPMTGGKLAGIITGGVALVAAIVCGVIFLPNIFKPAKDVVIDAFEATMNSQIGEQYFSDATDMEAIIEKFSGNGGRIYLSLGMNDMDLGYDMGIAVDEIINPKDKLVQYSVAALSGGEELIKINAYGDETNTYLELEDAIDGYFMLPNDDPAGAIASSYIGQYFSTDELTGFSSVSLDYFSKFNDETDDDSIYSGYVDAIETLWDSAEFKKEGTAKIDVNGKTVKAKEYTVTLKESDIEKALTSLFDGVTQMYADNPEMLEQMGMDQATFDSTMSQVKALIPSLVNSDFVVKVYIKDKKVVKVTSEDSISLYGASIKYDFFFDIDDNDMSSALNFDIMGTTIGYSFKVNDMKGNANGNLTMSAAGENIVVNFNTTKQDTADATSVDFNAELLVNGQSQANVNGTCALNKTDNSFNVKAIVNAEGESMDITMSGALKDVVKGISFRMVIDELSISYNGEKLATLNLEYIMDTSVNTVQTYDSSKPVYEVAGLTEDDMMDIIVQNQNNLIDWITAIMQNPVISDIIGGFDYGDDDIYVDDDYDDYDYGDDDEYYVEDMMIEGNEIKIQMLESLPGLECTYDGSYIIEFSSSDYNYMVDYSVVDNYTPDEAVNLYFYYDDSTANDEGAVDELNMQMTLSDGSTVSYSYSKRISGTEVSIYAVYAKDLGNGSCLLMEAYVYVDEGSAAIGEGLLDKNFEIVQ